MKKVWLIGWKDLTLAFRDRAALVLMLAAPFALTLGLGFVTGAFSGSGGGLSSIPVLLVNQDGGQLGKALVDVFQSQDLATLVAPQVVADPAEARRRVDADEAAAAVIIPAGFTESVLPAQGQPAADVVRIGLYTSPARPTGSGVVRAVVDAFTGRVEVARITGEVVAAQLSGQGLLSPAEAAQVAAQAAQGQANAGQSTAITVNSVTAGGETVDFNVLAYMAPGMALMFLMYTVANGGRTLLAERAEGTLSRLFVSPTASAQVLGGKVLGVMLTGTVQVLILIVASALFFRLQWGNPLAVLALVLAAVIGATGWGMLITAMAKTPGQVNAIGSAVMLTFGILGGTFIDVSAMPAWFRAVTRITPNAWGLDGFTTLAMGGGAGDIMQPLAALLVMGVLLFGVAAYIYSRRGVAQP